MVVRASNECYAKIREDFTITVDPLVSRHEIGTPTQLSYGTGGYKTLC